MKFEVDFFENFYSQNLLFYKVEYKVSQVIKNLVVKKICNQNKKSEHRQFKKIRFYFLQFKFF